MDKRNIAIITARGGSKRIPRKNIKPFLGRPIMEYSIEAAIQSECFKEQRPKNTSQTLCEDQQIRLLTKAQLPILYSVLGQYENFRTRFQIHF